MTEFFAWLVALPLAATLAYLALELLCGLRRLPRRPGESSNLPIRLVLLVPAHNEEAGIAQTVAALSAAAPGADILVVADNCSDDTARGAEAAGARVAVRTDPDHRGKGYALAFGRDHLAADPPDAVIVVDADCELAPGSADRLAARALATGRPVQAANLLTSAATASPLVAVSNFAMLVKNLVRARGLTRIGGGALLFGTGMAFAWPLFARLPLATGDAVEDLNLGLWLARQGVAIDLDDMALVTSNAAPAESSRAQRSRWEHGFLRTAARQGMPMLLSGVASGSRLRAALGAHLLIPPLALLMLLSLLGLALLAATAVAAARWGPFLLAAAALAGCSAMLLIIWWRFGRGLLPFSALLRVPFYIAWKIPIYVGFFTRNQKDWNRTKRDGDRF